MHFNKASELIYEQVLHKSKSVTELDVGRGYSINNHCMEAVFLQKQNI